MIDDPEQPEWFNKIMRTQQPQIEPPVRSSEIVHRPGYKYCETHNMEYLEYCLGCALQWPANDQAQPQPPPLSLSSSRTVWRLLAAAPGWASSSR